MTKPTQKTSHWLVFHLIILTALRVAIGWHFLYEGVVKIFAEDWSAKEYLAHSSWLLSGLFQWIAATPWALALTDFLNAWGLTAVGVALILGALTRTACVAGIVLMLLYYIAMPPFVAAELGWQVSGHYLLIDRNVIEALALAVIIFFPTGQRFGLDRILPQLIARFREGRAIKKQALSAATETTEAGGEASQTDAAPAAPQRTSLGRREVLKSLATAPVLGIFGIAAARTPPTTDSLSGATIQVSKSKIEDLKGELPSGEIAGKKISRIILGGNLIGGWAHSRDLIYVPSLFRAYNTEQKIFETLSLAEQAGVNTMNLTGSQLDIINKYRRLYKSQLQIVCQVHPKPDDIYGDIDRAIDGGVDFIQIQGNCTDWRVRDGQIDILHKAIDYIRKQKYPAGLGAHAVQALQACADDGLIPDFYMKTLHSDDYWSAHPKENRIPFSVDGPHSKDHNQFCDNMFCLFPDETIEFMKNSDVPFMAFKVLAAGAIHPDKAFRYALQNGADFLCVGMFDFQIVDDVNIAIKALGEEGIKNRPRPWRA